MSKATRAAFFGTRLPGSVARREAKIALELAASRGPETYAYRFHHWYDKAGEITGTIEVRVWGNGKTKVTACHRDGSPLKNKPPRLKG